MSLIMGVWMVSADAYQRLALTLKQQETKKLQIWKQMDAYEHEIYSKAASLQEVWYVKNDFARVSSRTYSLRASPQSSAKDKRSISN